MKKDNSNHPPKWALAFLRLICPEHLFEEIEGDLIERFNKDVANIGEKKARRRFTWNAMRYFRPGIILRNKFTVKLNTIDLLSSYFKIGFRHVIRSKVLSAINIFGLALGITFS